MAAPRPLLGRRGDEELHVGERADHRADVAPVENRAGRLRGEPALEVEERLAHRLERRDDRGRLAHLGAAQARVVEDWARSR